MRHDTAGQRRATPGWTRSVFSRHPAGRKPNVLVKRTRRSRKKVLFTDASVRELVMTGPESAPVIGLGSSGKAVSVDLDAESRWLRR